MDQLWASQYWCQEPKRSLLITGPFTLGAHTRIWECHLLVVAPAVESACSFARLYATSLFSDDVAMKITRSRRVGGPAFSAPYPHLLAGRANLVGEREAVPMVARPSEPESQADQNLAIRSAQLRPGRDGPGAESDNLKANRPCALYYDSP